MTRDQLRAGAIEARRSSDVIDKLVGQTDSATQAIAFDILSAALAATARIMQAMAEATEETDGGNEVRADVPQMRTPRQGAPD